MAGERLNSFDTANYCVVICTNIFTSQSIKFVKILNISPLNLLEKLSQTFTILSTTIYYTLQTYRDSCIL